MPNRTIATRLSIEGEKEYKQAISEINSGMKVLRSEMQLVSAEYENNAGSVEALSKKGEVLEREILSQREKVETMKAALQNAAESYGESDRRTENWQISLNRAQADLIRMNRELDANREAVAQAAAAAENGGKKFHLFSGEAQGLGDMLDKVGGKLGIDLPNGLQESLNGIGKINPATAIAAGGFAALVTAIEKAEDKLEEMALKSAVYADEILTNSMNTGLDTDTLQELEYASELIDVSSDTIQGSMAKLVRSLGNAKDGSKEARKAFSDLGVAFVDDSGKLRDSEDVFFDVIDALGQIENTTERDAASMELFGKSAQDLNSLIVQGSDKLQEYADEAHNMGYVLSEEDLAALGAVDDAQQRLLKTQEAVSNQISAEYAPYMESALTKSGELWQMVGEELTKSGVVENLGSILQSAIGLMEPLVQLGTSILPLVSGALNVVAKVLAPIADLMGVVSGLLTLDFHQVGVSLGLFGGQGEYNNTQRAWGRNYAERDAADFNSYYNPETGLYEGNYNQSLGVYSENYYHASGTDYFRGGWSWVGEAGPEKVYMPAGTVIANAQESRSGGDSYSIVVYVDHIEEMEDLVRLAKNARRMERMGGGQA